MAVADMKNIKPMRVLLVCSQQISSSVNLNSCQEESIKLKQFEKKRKRDEEANKTEPKKRLKFDAAETNTGTKLAPIRVAHWNFRSI